MREIEVDFTPWPERELQKNDDGTLYDPFLKDYQRCPKCGQCEDVYIATNLYQCGDCLVNWTEEQWPEFSVWDFYNCPEGEEHRFPVPM